MKARRSRATNSDTTTPKHCTPPPFREVHFLSPAIDRHAGCRHPNRHDLTIHPDKAILRAILDTLIKRWNNPHRAAGTQQDGQFSRMPLNNLCHLCPTYWQPKQPPQTMPRYFDFKGDFSHFREWMAQSYTEQQEQATRGFSTMP